MTTVVVFADPPHPDTALSRLVEETPISPSDAVGLYTALLRDTVLAVDRSGGELLVNYRPADALGLDVDSATELRTVVSPIFDPDDVRFEVQVGETFAGRVGNTATHLLETEGVSSVGIARPEAALFARTDIDSAAMKLRSSPVILGPAQGGRINYAAFAEPIDFADCYAPPALETLTDRAHGADLSVSFLDTKPFLSSARDLADVLVTIRTRQQADALVPPYLAAWVDTCDLGVSADDDGVTIEQ